MAYHFKAGEPVPNEIRRIVGDELKSAAKHLSDHAGPGRDEAIHEARKSLKKVRAVLRLVQGQLGDVYRPENIRMREMGRKLSAFRDADAIIETFDHLRKKYRQDLGPQTLMSMRRRLVAMRDEHLRTARIEPVMRQLSTGLRRSERRVNTWPLTIEGFDAIGPGLLSGYRRGRKAMALAQRHPLDENYHEWRKRAKDLWYHVRLLENMWTGVLQAYEDSLDDLQEWLGDDHNLVVLRNQVLGNPRAYGNSRQTGLLLELIAEYQQELRTNALALGQRIYEERPRDFRSRMKGLWEAWQSPLARAADNKPSQSQEDNK